MVFAVITTFIQNYFNAFFNRKVREIWSKKDLKQSELAKLIMVKNF